MRPPRPTPARAARAHAAGPTRRAVVQNVGRLLALSSIAQPALLPPATTAGEAAAAATVAAAALAAGSYAVDASELDPRSFRGLVLDNGLRVLLASEPGAKKAAAAMNVQVGWMSDPTELPGLAHFCEHMLFLGTKTYPREGDFEQYVGANGGSNNAFTDSEDTCYFFDIGGEALPGGLARFADFFVAPLFTESATGREVNAIQSEHDKNLQTDFWRFSQLLKLRARQDHPYSHFSTGNRQTLRGGDKTARAALLDFHKRYYRASQMELAVIGPQPLDELQAAVEKNFASIQNPPGPAAHDAYDALPLPFDAAGPPPPPELTLMVPVNEKRTLEIEWNFPISDLPSWIRTKPEILWRSLLSGRFDNQLLPYLKERGLATSLGADADEETRTWALCSVSIDLTEEGYARWTEVAAALFAYLRMLSARPLPPHVFDDAILVNDLAFKFAEPGNAQDFATAAVSGVAYFDDPKDWLTGPALLRKGAEPGVAEILRRCTPAAAIVTLVAPEVAARPDLRTEPIYGTKYATVPMGAEVAAWERAPLPSGLGVPKPNRFLPRSLALKAPTDASEAELKRPPALLGGTASGARLHFKQDASFARPRAVTHFWWRTNALNADPTTAVASEVYQGMISDALQATTYEASLGALSAGIGAGWQGLTLSVNGFDDRLAELADKVAAQLRTAPVRPVDFNRRKESLLQTLANLRRRQPIGLARYYRSLALETGKFSLDELEAAAAALTISDVSTFQKNLLREADLEALVCGNMREAEARSLLASLQKAVPAAPLPPERRPVRRVRRLRRDADGVAVRQFVGANAAEKNGACELFFQVGRDEGDDWALLALAAQLVEQPFYGELRTKQQLGYIVASAVAEEEGVRGLVFAVQSAVLPPPELQKRIEAFVGSFRQTLSRLSDAELKAKQEALAQQAIDVDTRLGQQAGRFWGEIALRRYDYGRPWRVAEKIRRLRKAELLALWDDCIAPGGRRRRPLVTHIFPLGDAPAELRLDPIGGADEADDEFWPLPEEGVPPEATADFGSPEVVAV